MARIHTHFATEIFEAPLPPKISRPLNVALKHSIEALAQDDEAGRRWSARQNYKGYTSYASLADLAWRDPAFERLSRHLDKHARSYARHLQFDLGGTELVLDSLWVNLLEPGAAHSGHIHPHSIISGTYYVAVPPGAGEIKFEDPRLAFMMAAPPRMASADKTRQSFIYIKPRAGLLLMWESWLRHEVLPNGAKSPRLSVSFNYSARSAI